MLTFTIDSQRSSKQEQERSDFEKLHLPLSPHPSKRESGCGYRRKRRIDGYVHNFLVVSLRRGMHPDENENEPENEVRDIL
jgi:hypothetical protein